MNRDFSGEAPPRRLKVNWFSPLLPARTDIAHYTARVLPALAEVADVTLWTDQKDWDSGLERHAKVTRFQPDTISWLELNAGDVTFYNIGNNADFHLGIWQIAVKHAGVVVLHDIALQEFFAYCYRWLWGDRAGYLAKMAHYYGESGRHDGDLFWQDALTIDHLVERYPLTPLAMEGALAAIVHNERALPPRGRDACPVTALPLPYIAHEWPDSSARWQRTDPLRLVVFGYISRNRRMEAVLEALSKYPQRFRLDMFGQFWDPGYIKRLIHSLDLDDRVRLRGFVPEAELDATLQEAHLAFNLRFPTMGESSGSQLRIWDHSLAALATPVGWYGAVPEDAIGFVRLEHETEDIHAHLDRLRSEPAVYREMGRRGREILETAHSPRAYARQIGELLTRLPDLHRSAGRLRMADNAVDTFTQWITPAAVETMVHDAAMGIAQLSGDSSGVE